MLLEESLYRGTEGMIPMYVAWAKSHSTSQVGRMVEVIRTKNLFLP